MPSQLLALPDELLLQILSHLLSPDVAACTRVCQRLFRPADRLLYRRGVHLKNNHDAAFALAIARQPERAPLVEQLTVHHHGEDAHDKTAHAQYERFPEELAPSLEKLLNLRALAVKGTQPCAHSTLADELGWPEEEAQTQAWPILFRKCAEPGSRILPLLTTCFLKFHDTARWDFDARAAILLHPSLRTLTVHGAASYNPLDLPRAPAHSTALTELNLIGCEIWPSAFSTILRIPSALKRLSLGGMPEHIRLDRINESPEDEPTRFIDGIYKQQHSLEFLDFELPLINFIGSYGGGDTAMDAEQLALHRLSALRELHINAVHVESWYADSHGLLLLSHLPPTLQTLYLETYMCHIDAEDPSNSSLAALVRETSPSWAESTQLRHYFLLCKPLRRSEGGPAVSTHVESFTVAGVHFEHRRLIKQIGPDSAINCHCCENFLHCGSLDYVLRE